MSFLCRKTPDSIRGLTAIRKEKERNFLCIISDCDVMSYSTQQKYGDTNPLISESYCSYNLPETSIKSPSKLRLTIPHFLDYYNSTDILFVMKGIFFLIMTKSISLFFSLPTFSLCGEFSVAKY